MYNVYEFRTVHRGLTNIFSKISHHCNPPGHSWQSAWLHRCKHQLASYLGQTLCHTWTALVLPLTEHQSSSRLSFLDLLRRSLPHHTERKPLSRSWDDIAQPPERCPTLCRPKKIHRSWKISKHNKFHQKYTLLLALKYHSKSWFREKILQA